MMRMRPAAARATRALERGTDHRTSNAFKFMSLQTWAAILAAIGFMVLLARLGAPTDTEKQQLRSQFRLPDDVALTEMYVGRSSAKPFPADIEGIVRFTDAEFAAYKAELDRGSAWKPRPIFHGGTEFHGPYAADALFWRDLDGAHQLTWGSLSRKQAQATRNGKLLCFTLPEGGSAVPCAAGRASRVRSVHVQGLLNFDTRELHMLVRQSRP